MKPNNQGKKKLQESSLLGKHTILEGPRPHDSLVHLVATTMWTTILHSQVLYS
jgi:hypothetical protein